MSGPFGRVSASARAEMQHEDDESWDAVAAERERRVEEYSGRAREEAIAHAQIARRRANFHRELAGVYERVAKGLPAFEGEAIR